MIHKFLALSGLMRTRSLSGLLLSDMTAPLAAVLGQHKLEPLSIGRLPVVLREQVGIRRPAEWLAQLIAHSDCLKRHGLNCLLLDTLQYLEPPELGQVAPRLQLLAQRGIQTVVMDQDRCPIVLGTLHEIVATDQYIDIYVRSLQQRSWALTQSQQEAAEQARRRRLQPRRFRLLERVFVG